MKLSKNQRDKLNKVAEKHYYPIPYHNFKHALGVAQRAERIANEFTNEIEPFKPSDYYIAGLFHDAGYIEDHKAYGFDTKESYSAEIARDELEKLGFREGLLGRVERLILATYPKSDDHSFQASLLRVIDFGSFVKPFKKFIKESQGVRQELQEFGNKKLSDENYFKRVKSVADKYIERDSQAAKRIYGDKFDWENKIRKNIAKLKRLLDI